jgi:hypothetical protein
MLGDGVFHQAAIDLPRSAHQPARNLFHDFEPGFCTKLNIQGRQENQFNNKSDAALSWRRNSKLSGPQGSRRIQYFV